ncbi:acetamidase/formamidase [Krasilnikovia cinnamomea]|uniref:Acetamidase/formamidase n=1 Tax=Krasilnikovia cinnamomea TaxID=349313 RepID=A0A4Q7ZJZ1_9ACTN|nr:acetamidase/formamidase family protein [Krasilnikovia cinnamomea]RZU51228.1 acetamidase/formamidase [Krasilnikovia cinnamomea]
MADVVEYAPQAHQLAYTFGGRQPVLRVEPGTVMRIHTEDCFGGAVRTMGDLPSQVCRFPELNPVSGPFYVAGAEPGDTLALHLVSLTPARDWGVSSTFPHFGALTSTAQTATLQPPLEERVWRYDIDTAAGTVRYTARRSDYTVDLPLAPMLGTIGVAPAAGETRMTIVPDLHGGNMDTPELRAGTTLYLPVNVPGALFAVGDGHARQGDGEACGVAVETAMTVVLIPEVIKGIATPAPRLESDTALMCVGSARPLEDAYRTSHTGLVRWTTELTGLETLDAYQLVSQAGRSPVGNVCDPNYTILAVIDKAYLHGAAAYGGAHDRLRALAAHHDPGRG